MPTSLGAATFDEWWDGTLLDRNLRLVAAIAWNAGVHSAYDHFKYLEGIDSGDQEELKAAL